jgi:RNA polymerase sigma-70 factor (ECF subfamily)
LTKDEIVAGCLKGKRKAQEELYNLYGSRMFGVCLRYTQNRMEAQDVLQEGFVKVFKNIESFKNLGENSLGNWIKRIMVNTAINFLRDQKKHRYMMDVDIADNMSDETEDDFFTELISLVSTDEILEIVQKLPNGYRMVFNLFAIEGYSHAEIADELRISVNTSKTQLFKARLSIVSEIRVRAESRINVRQVI